jgi:hypothetical protein
MRTEGPLQFGEKQLSDLGIIILLPGLWWRKEYTNTYLILEQDDQGQNTL